MMTQRLANLNERSVLYFLVMLALLSLTISFISHISSSDADIFAWLDGATQNFSTEMMGAIVTFFMFEQVLGKRQRKQQTDAHRQEMQLDYVAQLRRANTAQDRQLILDTMKRLDLFQYADLSRAQLRDADLTGVNLQHANLEHANLQGATLEYAKLQHANLEHANLQQASLQHVDLQQINLLGANLQGANLQSTNLSHAILRYAKLQHAILRYANLQQANLRYADLKRSILVKAELEQADLLGADLRWSKLMGANCQNATLRNAVAQKADMRGIDLREANLEECDLQYTNLASANLQHTNLSQCKFQYANLKGACFKFADFTKAEFNKRTILPSVETYGINIEDVDAVYKYWSVQTDMRRYTHPEHPIFWEPRWVVAGFISHTAWKAAGRPTSKKGSRTNNY